MTQDDMRRLLGGYATNSLSADERRMLFEAALENQDLFNALNDEDALRELLEDPALRDQVRAALQTAPASAARSARFSWRIWTVGVAVPAMTALIVIAVMYQPQMRQPAPPALLSPAQNIPPSALNQVAPEPKAEPRQVNKQLARIPATSRQPAIPPAAPAREIARGVREAEARAQVSTLAAPAVTSFRAGVPAATPAALQQQIVASLSADAALYQGPLVKYSVMRSGPEGSDIRVEVSTRMAAYLVLYETGAANPVRVYPENEAAAPIAPDVTVQIPPAPIKAAPGTKLRLVVVPLPSGIVGAIGGVPASITTGAAPASRVADSLQAAGAPLVIDIPLVP